MDTGARAAALHRLHESGCFVIPNPWDLGSARVLVQLGFEALATTSSGFAWSIGRSDDEGRLEDALAHFRQLSAGVDVPVSGDFQDGFATDPDRVAENVRLAIDTGLAGLSIEDSMREGVEPLYDFGLALERVQAAVEVVRESETRPLLTARTEGFIVGRPDLDETVRRLAAFAEAGADCLYAPGIRTDEEIRTVVEAVAPKPVNVLVGGDFTTVDRLAELGVRRISVGGALARAAWGGFLAAAEDIAGSGTFTRLNDAAPFGPLDGRFGDKS
ncbi:MAG: isocitrate lyase/phosphoenolpyruvate mutase family protein [Gemmatimonadota bacterium]|nr:isocitrate lyase/phosphoenolpyruvate mutase family protein [Gemmatimonadota bacterium]